MRFVCLGFWSLADFDSTACVRGEDGVEVICAACSWPSGFWTFCCMACCWTYQRSLMSLSFIQFMLST